MKPIYEENEETLEIAEQISCHIPPHLHKSMELVSVTEGTLEIGVGTELYHMEKGDFALVFPELIHHYQVFNSESCKAIYALASPLLAPSYTKELQQFCPVNPVILAQEVHPDVNYALRSMLVYPAASQGHVLHQAFIQIILARTLPLFEMIDKGNQSDTVQKCLRDAERQTDEQIRLSTLYKAEKALMEDVPMIPLQLRKESLLLNRNLTGFETSMNLAGGGYVCSGT